jgi:hypothetical protein
MDSVNFQIETPTALIASVIKEPLAKYAIADNEIAFRAIA